MNENFKKALYDALIPEFSAMLPDAEGNEHQFSPAFEEKMQRLIKRRKKPYYQLINTFGKRVACVLAIIIVASSVTIMSVKAFREAVADFFISIYEKFSTVQSADETNAPETIEAIYDITYNLNGYEVIFEERLVDNYWKILKKDEITISYSQYTKKKYNKDINTEHSVIEIININGYEAIYFIDNQNYNHLILDNEDYIIEITTNLDKKHAVEIIKSVQKVE